MNLHSIIPGLRFLFAALWTVRPKFLEAFVWMNFGYAILMKCLALVPMGSAI